MTQKDAEQTADRFLKLYRKGFVAGEKLAQKNLASSIYFLFQVTSRNPKLVFKIEADGKFRLGQMHEGSFVEDEKASIQAQNILAHLKDNNPDLLVDSIKQAFTLNKSEYERHFKQSLPRH